MHLSAYSFRGRVLTTEEREAIFDFFNAFLCRYLPCPGCTYHCFAYVRSHPPRFQTGDEYWSWTVAFHNAVNVRTKKRVWSEEDAERVLLEYIDKSGARDVTDTMFDVSFWYALYLSVIRLTFHDKGYASQQEQTMFLGFVRTLGAIAPFRGQVAAGRSVSDHNSDSNIDSNNGQNNALSLSRVWKAFCDTVVFEEHADLRNSPAPPAADTKQTEDGSTTHARLEEIPEEEEEAKEDAGGEALDSQPENNDTVRVDGGGSGAPSLTSKEHAWRTLTLLHNTLAKTFDGVPTTVGNVNRMIYEFIASKQHEAVAEDERRKHDAKRITRLESELDHVRKDTKYAVESDSTFQLYKTLSLVLSAVLATIAVLSVVVFAYRTRYANRLHEVEQARSATEERSLPAVARTRLLPQKRKRPVHNSNVEQT